MAQLSALGRCNTLSPKTPDPRKQLVFGLRPVSRKHEENASTRATASLSELGLGSRAPVNSFVFHKFLCKPARMLWIVILLEYVAVGELRSDERQEGVSKDFFPQRTWRPCF